MSLSSVPDITPISSCLSPKRQRSKVLGKEITELYGFINAATAQLLTMIREFDQQKLWHLNGICSCAHWLNWQCGIGIVAAREKVRVANALGKLEKISAAFSSGEISYSKVRAMTRVATPDNEDYLLRIARNGTAHHVETLVRKYRRAKKLQETGDAQKQHDERSVHFYYEPDGSMVIKARLPAEKAELVLKAIEMAMQQDDPPEAKDSAESSGVEAGENDIQPVPTRREGWDQRRADALTHIAESYLANGPAASATADRYQVVLHVSAETLTNSEGHLSHLENGPHVAAETSRRLCCDAGISVLTEAEDGTPLNIGRKSRIIPPAMRRALKARDEGCQFPGCTLKHYIDGHHIWHWSKGGETSLANLVQLCRHHHRLVHEGGFTCTKNSQDKVEFRNPNGELIARAGYIPAFSSMLDITERMRNRYEDLFIDANTCVTQYDGGGIDWNMAVSAMYQ